MAWLTGLVHSAEAIPAVRRRLHFQANPLAVVEAGRVVLPERLPGGKEVKRRRSPRGRRKWSNAHCSLRNYRSRTRIWWGVCRR
jgi:hypothetical protein